MNSALAAIDVDCAASESGEAGFTLLESIIGLAILALSIGVLFNVISTAVGRTSQSDSFNRARLLAQSILAQVGNEIPAKPGEVIGEEGGRRWRLEMRPYGGSEERLHWSASVLEVSAEVSWGNAATHKSLAISTLRLIPKSVP